MLMLENISFKCCFDLKWKEVCVWDDQMPQIKEVHATQSPKKGQKEKQVSTKHYTESYEHYIYTKNWAFIHVTPGR